MLHITLAVGDFMLILIGAALWIGGGILGVSVLGLVSVCGTVFAFRRHRRRRAAHQASRAETAAVQR